MIEIVDPGPLATVQDAGRPGYAALGVPASGAFDRASLGRANRLVGNPESAAGLEITFGGLHLRCLDATTLAFGGAPCPGAPDWGVAITGAAGLEIRLGPPARGVRSYLAVRGGIDVRPVLGSRSTDTLSGIGPSPLRPGDRLPVGAPPSGPVSGAAAAEGWPGRDLTVIFGPRDDWFTAEARAALLGAEWVVRPESDRIGLRLDGPRLGRSRPGELPSEPVLPGAIQVPPDGRPIVFGPDAPVTGGYPVIAVLTDLTGVAQLRPGDRARFSSAGDPGPPTPGPPPRRPRGS